MNLFFKGTTEGREFGDYGVDRVHGGAAGFEIDRANFDMGTPRHALVLARSTELKKTVEHVKVQNMVLNITYDPPKAPPSWAAAEMVFFETVNGGAVFAPGSICWFSSTPENDYDNDVARISRNVIKRFLDSTPFPHVPETEVDDVDRAPPNSEYD